MSCHVTWLLVLPDGLQLEAEIFGKVNPRAAAGLADKIQMKLSVRPNQAKVCRQLEWRSTSHLSLMKMTSAAMPLLVLSIDRLVILLLHVEYIYMAGPSLGTVPVHMDLFVQLQSTIGGGPSSITQPEEGSEAAAKSNCLTDQNFICSALSKTYMKLDM